jgi:Uma2 family endonuclease
MSSIVQPATLSEMVYPESDGQPMADNTLQFAWIVTIQGGIDALFHADPNIFVAGDLLWYPVEGNPRIRIAPDILVVFGRPKGHRGSYLQWREGNIPPQVVFEVLSPGNTPAEMRRKQRFYTRYGVEEYYIYDPDRGTLAGLLRQGRRLRRLPSMPGWVSPRLQVRFELQAGELQLYGPDGQRFLSYVELAQQATQATQQAAQATQQAAQATQQAMQAEQRAAQAEQRVAQLAARLRALGIDPDRDAPQG